VNWARLDIYQGDDQAWTVTVLQNNQPADLTGYTAAAQIRSDYADLDATVDAPMAATITGNLVVVSVGRAATVKLAGGYFWDLQLTASDGTVTTVLAGPVRVTREVTRLAS